MTRSHLMEHRNKSNYLTVMFKPLVPLTDIIKSNLDLVIDHLGFWYITQDMDMLVGDIRNFQQKGTFIPGKDWQYRNPLHPTDPWMIDDTLTLIWEKQERR